MNYIKDHFIQPDVNNAKIRQYEVDIEHCKSNKPDLHSIFKNIVNKLKKYELIVDEKKLYYNLEYIREHVGCLYMFLKRGSIDRIPLKLFNSENGQKNMAFIDKGTPHFCYDKKDPSKEVRQYLKDKELKKSNSSIVFGIGLGYLAFALAKNSPLEHSVIIIEPNETMILLALSNHNFISYFKKFHFQILPTISELSDRFYAGLSDDRPALASYKNLLIMRDNIVEYMPDTYNTYIQYLKQVIDWYLLPNRDAKAQWFF